MKKFYLGALGCLLAMGVSAQKIEPVGGTLSLYGAFYSIPSTLAFNGESVPYSRVESEDGTEIYLYNKSFDIERTINVKNPTSYSRVETETREAELRSVEKRFDCTDYIGSWFDDKDQGYRAYYAQNCSENTTYTDKYVYEWVEYMKKSGHPYFENITIHSRVDYAEHPELTPGEHPFLSMNGVLYITESYDLGLTGFYFENNKVYAELFGGTYEETEECDTYYTYYDMQNAEFTQEYIVQFINYSGNTCNYFDCDSADWEFYEVDSIYNASNGEVFFYTSNRYEVDGTSYPQVFFVWKDDEIEFCYTDYSVSYTGEWVKSTENYSDDPGLVGFDIESIGSYSEGSYCIATQTLFNNDAKWEFLRKVYEERIVEDYWETREEDRDGDGEIDYKRTRYTNKVKGYEIVSEDGTVLATIATPLSDADYHEVGLLLWGEDAFLSLIVWKSMEEDDAGYEYFTTIYSIDKNTATVTKVVSAPGMRVSPTIANRNSTVNVTLDAETVKNGGELVITDSNGRTVGRSRVEAGQTSVPVTTDRMGSGVYNITLTEKGQKVENARIIVK